MIGKNRIGKTWANVQPSTGDIGRGNWLVLSSWRADN